MTKGRFNFNLVFIDVFIIDLLIRHKFEDVSLSIEDREQEQLSE